MEEFFQVIDTVEKSFQFLPSKKDVPISLVVQKKIFSLNQLVSHSIVSVARE